ncbi:MAG TPA: hypothetical protein PLX89_16935, partial [Verrucomicrobiota bacterium]|nr:hypothetical protein [Verrucomicrobiota bacterium]
KTPVQAIAKNARNVIKFGKVLGEEPGHKCRKRVLIPDGNSRRQRTNGNGRPIPAAESISATPAVAAGTPAICVTS